MFNKLFDGIQAINDFIHPGVHATPALSAINWGPREAETTEVGFADSTTTDLTLSSIRDTFLHHWGVCENAFDMSEEMLDDVFGFSPLVYGEVQVPYGTTCCSAAETDEGDLHLLTNSTPLGNIVISLHSSDNTVRLETTPVIAGLLMLNGNPTPHETIDVEVPNAEWLNRLLGTEQSNAWGALLQDVVNPVVKAV